MVKIRLEGTREENERMQAILEVSEARGEIEVMQTSEPYPNRGKSKFERVYMDIEVRGTASSVSK